jgi:endo-1,4-beta-xylanase
MRRLLPALCLLASLPLPACLVGDRDPPALKRVFRKQFRIGASVSPGSIRSEEAAILLRHFNSVTTENALKMGPVHPEAGRYDFAGADSIAAFAHRHGLGFRGHTLVWHKQAADWMFRAADGRPVPRDTLLQRLREHIHAVAGRYRGKAYAWDVVNEAVSDDPDEYLARTPFLEIIGPEYIALAFRWAHEADPEARLFYNDYRETDPVKRRKIIRLVTDLKRRGVPIHGIGLQCHWSIFGPKEAELEAALRDFAATGLPLHVTELDVSVWPDEPARREKRPSDADDRLTPERAGAQASQYAMAFRLFRRYAAHIDAVTFWNITDRHSWLDDWPVRGRNDHPLLFDESLRPKPAFWRVVEGR